ncbi:MAG: GAF domain-containing protein, partial [Gammaproteobacteria bacterium]|nr:GAF domain-containing protein [Gammaproteobacteria bacterium]
ISAKELVHLYKNEGYDGVVITDHYFNGYFEEALACIYSAEPYLLSLSSHIAIAIHCYYHSLIMTKLYDQKDEKVQKEFLEKLKGNLTRLQQWAQNCPENFQYYCTLIAAEIAKLQKNNFEAIELYDKAIDLLEMTEFTQEIALANELAANFWLENGKKNYAKGLLCTAYNYYLKWGAHYKVVILKSQYSDLLDITTLNPNSSFDVSGEYTVSAYSLKLLNLSSILQASQAISKNIDLDNLLNNIMKIAIENAGAQKGTFFILEEDKLLVQAEYMVGGNIDTLQRLLINDWTNGAKSIINYVQRTLRHVLLGNASSSQMFNQDPYVIQYQVKSTLCLPIIKNKQLKAILYLENNLSPHAFTEQHLEMLLLLMGQMVISLENAHHFAKEIALAREIKEKDQQRELALRSANMGIFKIIRWLSMIAC